MSSIFLWGASVGFVMRGWTCRSQAIPQTARPWLFAKYALLGGIGASYFEWIKRIALEDLCKKEEIREQQLRYWTIDALGLGEETYGDLKQQFLQCAVEEQMP